MPKSVEEIVAEIAQTTSVMKDTEAAEFLDDLKDEIETMRDMIPEEEEDEEEDGPSAA